MKITIYASRLPEAEKTLKAIVKKATKYGVKFGWLPGDPYAKEVDIYETVYDERIHSTVREKVRTITVEAVDIIIEGEDMIKKDGWEVIAQLEHFDNGNLINRIDRSDYVTPGAWRTLPPHCEHCGITRQRNVTYIVKDAQGTYRQVGSTCLKDYTGIDPRSAVAFAELWNEITLMECNEDNYDPDRERGNQIYNVERVIALAADHIAKEGYQNVDSLHPTRSRVYNDLSEDIRPSESGCEKAKEIVDWLKTTECTDSLIRDCAILAQNGWCKLTHLGRLAYMPIAYDKELARQQKQREREAANAEAAKHSNHIGTKGQRMTFSISSFEYVTS
jgi:hypothetical protein